MFVNVEEGNAANPNGEQPLDIFVGELAKQLLPEWLKAIAHGSHDRLRCLALFDAFVEALFDENALERAKMQFVLKLRFAEFEFAFESRDQLLCICAQDIRDRHLDWPVVFDDNDSAGNGYLAVGECIKRIDQLFGADAARGPDLDLDLF